MTRVKFTLEQLDTWFFKEARPMESIGGSELTSQFPPKPQTLAGAVRTLFGDLLGIDWQDYNRGVVTRVGNIDLTELIGTGENTGKVRFDYPYIEAVLNQKNTRLFPVPADVLMVSDKSVSQVQPYLIQVSIGETPVECDLGKVLLPEIVGDHQGARPLENAWFTQSGWDSYLQGQLPAADEIIQLNDLISKESRLGIARDNGKGVIKDSMLYQTQHVRLNQDCASRPDRNIQHICLAMEASGIPQNMEEELCKSENSHLIRLGGESRMAHVTATLRSEQAQTPVTVSDTLKLIFTSPARFNSDEGWLPGNFRQITSHGIDIYRGELFGIELDIESICSGKPMRVGGWDQATHQPKPVRSFVPPGTCWFIKTNDPEKLQSAIAQQPIGELTQFGYGRLICAPWKDKGQHND